MTPIRKDLNPRNFRLLADHSAVGVWQISIDGGTIYANPAMCAMLELEGPGDLAGTTYHRFLSKESHPIVEREHRKRSAGQTSHYEIDIISKRGRRRRVLVSGAPLFSPTGELESYIGTFTDVTDRNAAEEALRQSEVKYRTLVETAHDCIWACDINGTVTFANQAWERVLGYKTDELVGRPFTDFLPPAEVAKGVEVFSNLLAGITYQDYETKMVTRDERVLVLSFNSTILRQATGGVLGVMGTAHDVTERRMAEALRADFSRQLLSAIEEERRRIARELHDNVGQSLAALGLQLHALISGNGRPEKERKKDLSRLASQVRKTAEAASQLARAYHPTEIADLGLSTAIRSFGHEFSHAHGVRFSLCEAGVLDRLSGDRALHVYRIVQEAMSNAAKHASATEVRVTAELSLGQVRLSVEDDGSGFDPAFDLSRRGLGLTSMRERAAMLGGNLTVQSQRGTGTRLEVSFPL